MVSKNGDVKGVKGQKKGGGTSDSKTATGDESKISLSQLKSELDENQLDLSMRQLNVVGIPVSALAQLPRATNLDLSSNLLEVLPLKFAPSLSHIVRLDLSQNNLVHLPDNFGELRNLNRLDLYKNRLEELPISFCRLTQLAWLDLKDNRLIPELSKVAGNCLNDKECQQAANRVVQYHKQLDSERERQRQKVLQEQREQKARQQQATDSAAAKLAQQQQASKKQQKPKRKHDKDNGHGASNEKINSADSSGAMGSQRSPAHTNKGDTTRGRRSCIGLLISCIKWAFLLTFLAAVASSFALYHNCTSKVRWVPQSAGFCQDLNTFTATKNFPPSAKLNLQKTLNGAKMLASTKASAVGQYFSTTDVSKIARDAWSTVEDWLVVVANWSKRTTNKCVAWFGKNAQPSLMRAWRTVKIYSVWLFEQCKLVARILLEMAIDFTEFALGKSAQLYHWSAAIAHNVYHNSGDYVDRIKFWWQNMK